MTDKDIKVNNDRLKRFQAPSPERGSVRFQLTCYVCGKVNIDKMLTKKKPQMKSVEDVLNQIF